MSSRRIGIQGLTRGELDGVLRSAGEPSYRSGQICDCLYKKGVNSFDEMTTLSKPLRAELARQLEFQVPKSEKMVSRDGTTKFRFTLHDGAQIESVWIPEEKRNTLCISSQVGCALKCAFCVTGVVGFKRNLDASEIVEQVRQVKVVEKLPVTNIVFMGMGEPLLNTANVIRAIDIFTDQKGLSIGKRRITVSTAGIAPEIVPFVRTTGVKVTISLTGATDASRNEWMPINRKYNLEVLKQTLRGLPLPQGKKISFEVVLMADRNDTSEETEFLADFLKGIPSKVNLIPYNENPYFPHLKKPAEKNVENVRQILMKRGIFATIRKNRGEDILAACGQLAGKETAKIDIGKGQHG